MPLTKPKPWFSTTWSLQSIINHHPCWFHVLFARVIHLNDIVNWSKTWHKTRWEKGKQRSKPLCNDPFCARAQHLWLDSLVGIESLRIHFVFALSGMRLEASFLWRQPVRFSAVTNYRSWIERSACLNVTFPKAEHRRSAHGRRLCVSSDASNDCLYCTEPNWHMMPAILWHIPS